MADKEGDGSGRWALAAEELKAALSEAELKLYNATALKKDLSDGPAVIREIKGSRERYMRVMRVSLPFKVGNTYYPAVANGRLTERYPNWPMVTLTWYDGLPQIVGDEVVVLNVEGGFEGLGVSTSQTLEKGIVWSIFMPASVVVQSDLTNAAAEGEDGGKAGKIIDGATSKLVGRRSGLEMLRQLPVQKVLRAQADATAQDIAAHFVYLLARHSNPEIKVSREDMIEAIGLLTQKNALLEKRWETLRDRLALAQYAMHYPDLLAFIFQSLVDLSGGERGNDELVAFLDDLRYGQCPSWSQIMQRINAIKSVRIPRGGIIDHMYRGLQTQPNIRRGGGDIDDEGLTTIPASILLAGPSLHFIVEKLEYFLSPEFQTQVAAIGASVQGKQAAALRLMNERLKTETAGLKAMADNLPGVRSKVRTQVVAGMKEVPTAMSLNLLADLMGMNVPDEVIARLVGLEAIQKALSAADFQGSASGRALRQVS